MLMDPEGSAGTGGYEKIGVCTRTRLCGIEGVQYRPTVVVTENHVLLSLNQALYALL